jgi:hypothetical protein
MWSRTECTRRHGKLREVGKLKDRKCSGEGMEGFNEGRSPPSSVLRPSLDHSGISGPNFRIKASPFTPFTPPLSESWGGLRSNRDNLRRESHQSWPVLPSCSQPVFDIFLGKPCAAVAAPASFHSVSLPEDRSAVAVPLSRHGSVSALMGRIPSTTPPGRNVERDGMWHGDMEAVMLTSPSLSSWPASSSPASSALFARFFRLAAQSTSPSTWRAIPQRCSLTGAWFPPSRAAYADCQTQTRVICNGLTGFLGIWHLGILASWHLGIFGSLCWRYRLLPVLTSTEYLCMPWPGTSYLLYSVLRTPYCSACACTVLYGVPI